MNPQQQDKLLSCVKAFAARDYQRSAAIGQELVIDGPPPIILQILLISLQRLNKGPEAGAVGGLFLSLLPSGNWDRLLIELSLGLATANDVLARAQTTEQRCQAHFFSGARALTEGRLDEARELFDACLEAGVPGVEAELAKIERVSAPPPSAIHAAAKRQVAPAGPAVVPETFSGAGPITPEQIAEVERIMPATPRVAGVFVTKSPAPATPSSGPSASERDPRALNEMALELATQGRHRDALPFAARAVELQRERGDETSGDYAQLIANLAGTYRELGQYQAAEPLLRKALELRRRHAEGRAGNSYFAGFTAVPLGQCLVQTAVLYSEMGRYQEAEKLYEEALEINRTALGEQHPSFATSLMSLGQLQLLMGKHASAETLIRRSVELKREMLGPKSPAVAAALTNLGMLHTTTGQYDAAISVLNEAIEIEKAANGQETPGTLNALADVTQRTGNYAEAERQMLRALELRRQASGESHPGYAIVLNNLGELYRFTGRYPESRRVWNEALELKRRILGEDHPSVAISLGNLGELHREMGDDQSAETYFRGALAIFMRTVGDEHPHYASVLNNLGALYLSKRDLPAALPYLEQARDIFTRLFGSGHRLTAGAHNNLGTIFESLGRWSEAESEYERAADGLRQALGDGHADYAAALSNQARLLRRSGRSAEAEALLRQALTIKKAALGNDHPHAIGPLVERAIIAAAAGRVDEALSLNLEAAAITDRAIGQIFTMGSERQRMGYVATLQESFDVFLSIVQTFMADRPAAVQAALDLVLRRKAIAAEALTAQREAVLGGRYPALADRFSELAALRMRIAQKSLAGPGPEGPAAHRKQLSEWQTSRERLEAELASEVPEMNLEKKLRDVDRQVVAFALPENSALVEFVRYGMYDCRAVASRGEREWQPSRYVAFVLPAGRPDSVAMIDLGEADGIDRMIATFRSAITGTSDSRGSRDLGAVHPAQPASASLDAGLELRARLFDPLRPALSGCVRLFIAPDGDVSRLPLEVLPGANGDRLIDTYWISYLGAGRDAARLSLPSAPSKQPAIVIADPDFDFGQGAPAGNLPPSSQGRQSREFNRSSIEFGRLPGTRVEGNRISAMLAVEPWLDAGALEKRLKACVSPRILHLATHGFFLSDQRGDGEKGSRGLGAIADTEGALAPGFGIDLENPLLRSGLALSGANTWSRGGTPPEDAEDGILTAEDVAGLNLTGTEMAVLSACETGLGEIRTGEGVFGLRRAFVLAGARTLVMSLWKVPDEQTQELMEGFYRRALAGQPRAQALRDAQIALKAAYPDPLYWGAFICQGDPGPLAFPPEKQ